MRTREGISDSMRGTARRGGARHRGAPPGGRPHTLSYGLTGGEMNTRTRHTRQHSRPRPNGTAHAARGRTDTRIQYARARARTLLYIHAQDTASRHEGNTDSRHLHPDEGDGRRTADKGEARRQMRRQRGGEKDARGAVQHAGHVVREDQPQRTADTGHEAHGATASEVTPQGRPKAVRTRLSPCARTAGTRRHPRTGTGNSARTGKRNGGRQGRAHRPGRAPAGPGLD